MVSMLFNVNNCRNCLGAWFSIDKKWRGLCLVRKGVRGVQTLTCYKFELSAPVIQPSVIVAKVEERCRKEHILMKGLQIAKSTLPESAIILLLGQQLGHCLIINY